jgi:hypothetical protein
MRTSRFRGSALAVSWLLFVWLTGSLASAAAPQPETFTKPRVIVLTDIGNEPDDSESMVRLLLYANELDIEGLVATTSTWLKDKVHPELIEERVRAYGEVLSNLRAHAEGYPEAARLMSSIRSGRPVYGMQQVGPGQHTPASDLIIAALKKPDPRPLWISIWGGARELAQALSDLRATCKPKELQALLSKLRVYSISDQDDAGAWARRNFPQLRWIASIHGFNEYGNAAWIGISSRPPTVEGADEKLVSHEWLSEHIRKGPLGSLYPDWKYIMEGDTASFLYLIPNGLGVPEHPEFGSWGGRYVRMSPDEGLYADATDSVTGLDGKPYRNNKATIWRWREAYQNDFAARIAWTLSASRAAGNHAPELVVNGQPGREPLTVHVIAGQTSTLDASGSSDPDGDTLSYRWFEYTDINPAYTGITPLTLDGATSAQVQLSSVASQARTQHHLILEVHDNGTPSLTRYRRIIVSVDAGQSP